MTDSSKVGPNISDNEMKIILFPYFEHSVFRYGPVLFWGDGVVFQSNAT